MQMWWLSVSTLCGLKLGGRGVRKQITAGPVDRAVGRAPRCSQFLKRISSTVTDCAAMRDFAAVKNVMYSAREPSFLST